MTDYLLYMCQESLKGTVSYNDLAEKIACETECNASKQAYYYRTKEETVIFFQHILAAVIKKKNRIDIQNALLKNKFVRILIQDSTIINLPKKLYELFSGVSNGNSTVCNARIQGVYDLIGGTFIYFSIDPFSKNDLKAVYDIPMQKGDLILRDRGYYVIQHFENMKEKGAEVISRYKHKTLFYDLNSHKEIDLLQELKKTLSFDRRVLSTPDSKTLLRILATPAPDDVVQQRRRRANMEAKHRKTACSDELLQLLGWTIFITTIEDETFTIEHACIVYSLRWRIECIFKTWKSNFNFDKIHTVSENQLRVLLHARFITISILYQQIFVPLCDSVYSRAQRHLSLIKFMRFISRNFRACVEQLTDITQKEKIIGNIIKYCTFEKRKRTNFSEIFLSIGEILT